MKCRDTHCNGESEFWRLSLNQQYDIHTCGECGREWGILVGVPPGGSKNAGGDSKMLGVTQKCRGDVALQSDPVYLSYPKTGVTTQFTAMNIELPRDNSERIRQLREAIDGSSAGCEISSDLEALQSDTPDCI